MSAARDVTGDTTAPEPHTRAGFARIIDGLPHCTGRCDCGRKPCTCSTGRITVIPTRPGWVARLRCKLEALPIRWSMLGNSMDAVFHEQRIVGHLATLNSASSDDEAKRIASAQIQIHQTQLVHLERKYEALLDRLLDLGEAP